MQKKVLIIGSGIAGCALALCLPSDIQVSILTRSAKPEDSNSFLAQGGIVTIGKNDSVDALVHDILRAGDDKNNKQAVRFLAENAAPSIAELLVSKSQVPFDKELGLEAAHSHARILHAADHTGKTIMQTMLKALSEKKNVTIIPQTTAIDLIIQNSECCGATVYQNNTIVSIYADATVLATGGAGQVYSVTSNPLGARGDGISMAYRAGAGLKDMEYVQFHPTVLASEGNPKVLISERVRGEGATLINEKGEAFMEKYNPEWKDLAPRDEVSRAIFQEIQNSAKKHVFLQFPKRFSSEDIKQLFPQISKKCQEKGVDIRTKKIPVVPAAHYLCGGILVDIHGKSTIPRLYAIGETSCTGLHGANRLASTSLVEGLVWAISAAKSIEQISLLPSSAIKNDAISCQKQFRANSLWIDKQKNAIQKVMWENVGIVRSEKSLQTAVDFLSKTMVQIEKYCNTHDIDDESIGMKNIAQTAIIIAQSALQNTENAGCHYRNENK